MKKITLVVCCICCFLVLNAFQGASVDQVELSNAQTDSVAYVQSLLSIDSLLQIKKIKEADLLLRKTKKRLMAAADSSQWLSLAERYHKMWYNQYAAGQFIDALPFETEARKIAEKYLSSNDLRLASAYRNYCAALMGIGNLESALLYAKKAQAIFLSNKLENTEGAAINLYNIGLAYSSLLEYEKSFQYLEKAKNICEEQQCASLYLTQIYIGLGNYYKLTGDLLRAKSTYQKSIALLEGITDPRYQSVLGQLYTNLGLAEFEDENYDLAIEYYERSIAIFQRISPGKSFYLAKPLLNLGALHQRKKEFQKADEYFKRANQIYISLFGHHHPDLSEGYRNLASLYLDQKKWAEALIQNELAIRSAVLPIQAKDSIVHQQRYFEAFLQRALITYEVYQKTQKLEDLTSTYHNFKKCIDIIQSLINEYQEPAAQQTLNGLVRIIFEKAISVGIQLADRTNNERLKEEALLISEFSKSYLLRQALRRARLFSLADVPDNPLLKEQALKNKLTGLETKLFQLGANSAFEAQIESTEREMLDTRLSLYQVKDSIKNLFPVDYDLLYTDQTVELAQVQQSLIRNNQTLVEYFVGEEEVFIFVIQKDRFEVYALEKDYDLDALIKKLMRDVDNRSKEFVTSSYQLYEKLFEPIEQGLLNDSSDSLLLIIPDGPLGYIPFESLLSEKANEGTSYKELPYLINRYQISTVFSISLLEEMSQKKHKDLPAKKFVGFAPYFSGEQRNTWLLDQSSLLFSFLPNNEAEVRKIQDFVGGDIVLSEQATEPYFKRIAPDYRIIHLATHGLANDTLGDFGLLAFTEVEDSIENELLFNNEIYNLRLNADMVVLSACATGIGELQPGEGMISLARGFSYAGAKSIITTLWNVNDESVATILVDYYKNLKKGQSKDAALRHAKLHYLSTTTTPDPHYWAAFIPIGDMSPVSLQSPFKWWYLLLAPLLLLVFGALRFFGKKREINSVAIGTLSFLLISACSSPTPPVIESPKETALDSIVHLEEELQKVPAAPRWDEKLSMEKHFVEIGEGVRLCVLEQGSGPVLVLINGGPGNTFHSFLPHFSAASGFSRIIYYDQRGTGLSDWKAGPSGYATTQAVDDLEALRKALNIDQWTILGHSYGGLIAQWYALRYPERLLGMVLVGSSVPMAGLELGEREYRLPEERRRIREVYSIDGQAVVPVHSEQVDTATLQKMIYNGYLNGDWKRQYFFKPSRERMAQIARYEWVHDKHFNRQVRQDGFSRDLSGFFDDFQIPTLIIEGAYDANWGADKPRLFATQHPNAQLVVVDSSAHYPFAEAPEVFFNALEAFVTRAVRKDEGN